MRMPPTVEPHEEAIRTLYLEINPPKPPPTATRRPAEPMSMSDSELLIVMWNAKNGYKVKALWDGDSTGYPSASEADFALVSHLGFYTGWDAGRMDALFKQSGRYTEERAEKWDRLGPETIKRAEAGSRGEVYKPPLRMKAADFKGFSGNGASANGATEDHATEDHASGPSPPPPDESEPASVSEPHPSSFMRTDTGNGEFFAHLFRNVARYDHQQMRWLIWREHWWSQDREEEIQQLAKTAIRIRGKRAWDIEDEQKRTQELSWALKSEARPRREALVWAARSESLVSDAGEEWDADPYAIGVLNGVVDLRTGQLREGRREDRITKHIPLDYDPNAPAPRWERFLLEIFHDPDLIRFIHRAVGYTLTGETGEQVLFLGHGEGSNGKSIFLEALREAFGPYAYSAAFSTLDSSSRNKVPQDIANLVGRRFVTAIETNEGVALNEGRVKALTGGDPITARFLFQNEFTFKPVAKFWLAVNHKPRIADDSYGFWRRICLIPFLRQFKGESREQKLDKRLKTEAAGILAWAVRGCLEWQKEGLQPPAILINATEDYQQESDALAGFIEECCVLGPPFKAKAGELFKTYQTWCDDQGMNPRERLSSRTFGERLGSRFTKKKEGRGLFYLGIGLLANPQNDSENFDFEREGCIDAELSRQNDQPRITGAILAGLRKTRNNPASMHTTDEIELDEKESIEEIEEEKIESEASERFIRGEI